MRRMGSLIFIGLMISSFSAFGQEVYRWVDEKGTIHFTDDLSLVPEKYQDQAQKKIPSKEPSPPSSPQVTEEVKAKKEPQSAPVQKDILGRGEGWWRARAKEWNGKLISAQKNYEIAFTAWKAKEKELEESKFRPDSFKRRLKADIKVLEEKVMEWEKQVEEARNMLDRVLPKEAEEYRADSNWVKIEK